MKKIVFFIGITLLISCENRSLVSDKNVIIHVQPFDDFSKSDLQMVAECLRTIYPTIVVNPSIPIPQSARNISRTRYRADSLIHILSRQTHEGHLTIGLTNQDISITKNGVADWGVMGLGFCPGKSCVASTFRLSKKNKLEQLHKLAIHELGHTEGLPHCLEKSCFMRDAEGKNPTNEETEFCKRCKKKLINKGWLLK